MTPKLSVIMAVYNTAPYLRRSLNSLCNQTFRDFEILCVNDGSTDESPDILKEYAAKDSRIRVITHEKNLGSPTARNSALEVARGEAIGIVDSDDVVSRNFFAELWNVYAAGGYDIVKGRVKERETDGTWYESGLNLWIKEDVSNFTQQWWSAIYRISFIRKYGLRLSTELTMGQDVLFLLQLIGHDPRIGFSDKAIYYYLRNNASVTKSQTDAFHLVTRLKIACKLKEYMSSYQEAQRRKVLEVIVKFLYATMNDKTHSYDWTAHLSTVKGILSGDDFYASLKDFPFLRQALNAENGQELKDAFKIASTCLYAKSLRENMGRKHS